MDRILENHEEGPVDEQSGGVLQHPPEGRDLRRALQIVSGLLQAVVKQAENIGEMDRWTIRHNGEVIAECTIGEALDMANEVLEPGK